MRNKAGIVFPIIFICFCVFAAAQINALPPLDDTGEVGMGFFPMFCVVIMLILSVVLIARSLFFPQVGKVEVKQLSKNSLLRLICVLLLMLVYCVVYEPLGFYISTYLFGFLLLVFMGERKILYLILFPAALVLFVYAGFVQLLGVVLPPGDFLYNLFPDYF